MYSRHPFFRHFSPVSYVFSILAFPLSLSFSRARIHTLGRIHAHDMHSPQFSSSRLFHRLFGLIRHFHRPTSPSNSHPELALNTRFLIDFSPSRAHWPAHSPTPFSASRQQRFRCRKTGRLLSIMKYWTAVSTPMVIITNYDIRRPTRKYRDLVEFTCGTWTH